MKISIVVVKFPDGTKNVEAFIADKTSLIGHGPNAASEYLASELNGEPGTVGQIKIIDWE